MASFGEYNPNRCLALNACLNNFPPFQDWNTPALSFYGKLGAKVQDGLLTTRYMNEALDAFCATPSDNGSEVK